MPCHNARNTKALSSSRYNRANQSCDDGYRQQLRKRTQFVVLIKSKSSSRTEHSRIRCASVYRARVDSMRAAKEWCKEIYSKGFSIVCRSSNLSPSLTTECRNTLGSNLIVRATSFCVWAALNQSLSSQVARSYGSSRTTSENNGPRYAQLDTF